MLAMKKRAFVMGTCGASLASGLLGHAVAASRSAAPPAHAVRQGPRPLGEAPGRREWGAYLDEPFVLHGQGGHWPVVLDRIRDLDAAPGDAQFVLGFSSSSTPPSGLYRIEHASGQAAWIGLTACGQVGGEPARLRAEFNLVSG
jgi:hypothetical protein